ncbi:MAG: SDR family oxidoreductase [Porticoccaceae bacterium]|jgi:NAD(P)-dependent dehydrogenase (short-subunit alcohol dehydrogenase family)
MSDLFSVAGRVALVTGGTSGIGYMIAKGLVAHGAKTYIVGRSADSCGAVAEELSSFGTCLPLVADLSAVDGVNALAVALAEREDALHILVNNAGAMYEAPLGAFTEEGWDQVVDLNLKSVFFLTQALVPQLRAGASDERPAAVVNIGSMGGTRVGPKENYSYQAAKAGLHHLTGSLGKRLGAEHITVNAIAPGFFPSRLTVITDEQMPAIMQLVPRRRMGRDDDIVGAVIHLASRAGGFITGAVIPLDGGMTL